MIDIILFFLGSSQSAGVKALILDNDEEPFIKTLGITFLPGSHALVGMLLTEVSSIFLN